MSSLGAVLDQAWNNLFYLLESNVSRTNLLNIAIILVVGIGGAQVLSKIIKKGLESTKVDDVSSKSGISKFLLDIGYEESLSEFIASLFRYAFYVLTLMALITQLGLNFLLNYMERIVSFFPRILGFSIILLVAFFIAEYLKEIASSFLRKRELSKGIEETGAEIPVYRLVGNFVKYFVYIIAVILGLRVFGFEKLFIDILLAGVFLTFLFLFVFSVRKVSANILSGVYLQLTGAFSLGDEVEVSGKRGKITGIGTTYLQLETEWGERLMVPNSKALNEIISIK